MPGTHQSASRSILFSVGAHALLFLLIFVAANLFPRHAVHVRPPGTFHGAKMMLYDTPGGAPAQAARAARKPAPRPSRVPLPVEAAKAKPATAIAAPAVPRQNATPSALGEGDIEMALLQYSPDPRPDLSTLPSGTRGDVILDVIIDQQGKVAHVTLVKGLGPQVDQTVIATAQQWTFTPATRDGIPIASSQELLFHYERS